MIPNIHQSIDEILKNADNSEKIIWQQLRLITGENAAIRQIYYEGVLGGSEFLVYNANKLYLMLQLNFNIAAASIFPSPFVTFYDQNNAIDGVHTAAAFTFNTVAANYAFFAMDLNLKNLVFSRIVPSLYEYTRLIGYKIIY